MCASVDRFSELAEVARAFGTWVMVRLRFPERIRAVAFCEFPVKPLGTLEETWPLIAEEFAKFRSPELGPELLMGQNLIVESAIPPVTVRKLSEEEMNYYRALFPNWESRRAMARLPRDWSFAGDPIDTDWVIAKYSEWLKRSPIPKLLITQSVSIGSRSEEHTSELQSHL